MRNFICMSGIAASAVLLSGCAVCEPHPYVCSAALALTAGSIALAADRGSDNQTHSLREPVNNNYPPRTH